MKMSRASIFILASLFGLAVVTTAGCASSATITPMAPDRGSLSPEATQPPSSKVPAPPAGGERTLVGGEFELPAARSFGEPGFHEVLTSSQSLPKNLGQTAGLRLVLALRDGRRPEQTCSRQHPLSGCATVDWSDTESRPGVPPGGVFENTLTVRLVPGAHTLHLSESGGLNDSPDPFKPG